MKFIFKLVYFSTGKLKKGHEDSIISTYCIKIAIFIFQILWIDLKKERIPICAKMAYLGLISIESLLFFCLVIFLIISEAIDDCFGLNIPIKIRVSYANLMCLIGPIE